MNSRKQVDFEKIKSLLQKVAPHKASELDQPIKELSPKLVLDYDDSRILFQADSSCNSITIGMKSTCRLEAHAYAFAVILSAIGTKGFQNLSDEQKNAIYTPADRLLNWAVGSDLAQWAPDFAADIKDIFGEIGSPPKDILKELTYKQRILGKGFFYYAIAFIILHELAHLKNKDVRCEGIASIEQEKKADQFAATWLVDVSQDELHKKLKPICGITIALLWLTILDIFLGPQERSTHPHGYDRLFQTLNQIVNKNTKEEGCLYTILVRILFVHIDTAGIKYDEVQLKSQQSDKERVNYLIDLISKQNSGDGNSISSWPS